MLQIAEAIIIARQVTEALSGKRIERVVANHSPRQFAWFYDNSEAYDSALSGSDLLSPPPRRFEPDLAPCWVPCFRSSVQRSPASKARSSIWRVPLRPTECPCW